MLWIITLISIFVCILLQSTFYVTYVCLYNRMNIYSLISLTYNMSYSVDHTPPLLLHHQNRHCKRVLDTESK